MRLLLLISLLLTIPVLLATGCGDDGVSLDLDALVEEPFSLDLPVTGQVTFNLFGVNGAVTVTADEEAEGISATGFRRVVSDTEADARERLADLRITSTSTAHAITIRTEQPERTDGRSYVVDYDIVVPSSLAVQAVNVNGDVTVEDMRSPLRVSNVNGVVTVRRARAYVEVANVNGDVKLSRVHSEEVRATVTNGRILGGITPVGESGGAVEFEAVNGDVFLQVPANVSAVVSAGVENGTIVIQGDLDPQDMERTERSVVCRLGSGEGNIGLRTVNGNIEVFGGGDEY